MICPICNKEFERSGRSRRIYCSDACYSFADNRREKKKEYLKQYLKTYKPVKKQRTFSPIYIKPCPITGMLFVAKRKNTTYSNDGAYLKRFKTVKCNCVICCVEYDHKYVTNYDRHLKVCSDKCRKRYKFNKKAPFRKIAKLRRRKRIRTAHVEPITPSIVFERYNYQCASCNIHTSPDHIGTNNPNEPTLDHIIPLSKGGDHSYNNLQLLCRQCNNRKSNKLI